MVDTFSSGDFVIFNPECNLNIIQNKTWIENNPSSFTFFNDAKDGAVFISSSSKAYNDCYLSEVNTKINYRASLWMIKKLNPNLKEFI
jgi:hypothetical protein